MGASLNGVIGSLSALLAALSFAAPVGTPVAHAAAPKRPPIRHNWIPYGPKRKSEMAAYAKRHYGVRTNKLVPKVIVEHWTQSTDTASVLSYFSHDVPDPELHELPIVCSHYLIDTRGRILQLVPLGLMCRHTVGLNDHAIGIEHVGMSDGGVMGNHAQLTASIRLTRFLRCSFHIQTRDIIGHNESLKSRFHHERVRSLRNQTHEDMKTSTMRRYRQIVARQSCG